MSTRARSLVSAVSVPWNAFVGVFIYYVLLTLLAIGVADLAQVFMAVAYLLPPAAYLGVIVARGVRALAALPIDIGHGEHALLH
jgi:hypothetical protein